MNLLDLGHDELRQICALVGLKDISSVAMSCRRLREMAFMEDYWERACNSLVRNAAYSLQHEDLRSFKRWLNASTFRVIYRLLVKLKCWPEGIWQCPVDHYFSSGKTDGSLTVIARKEQGVLHFTSTSRRDQEGFALDFQLHERGHEWPLLSFRPNWPMDMCLFLAAGHGRTGQDENKFVPALILRCLTHKPTYGLASFRFPLPITHMMENCYSFCCNIPRVPWPQSIPAFDSDAPAASRNLRRLEGIWNASYGPHGDEVVWVTFRQEPHVPLRGLHAKLEGLKITGDPNVPAGKLTFEVCSQIPLAGPYNGFEEEESLDGQYLEINRPIVMHGAGQSVLVNIEERPVAARYFGRGQINADPRRWDSEWEEVQLLVYEGQRPLFSILWSDLGYPSRHIMDFTPAELPGVSAASEADKDPIAP